MWELVRLERERALQVLSNQPSIVVLLDRGHQQFVYNNLILFALLGRSVFLLGLGKDVTLSLACAFLAGTLEVRVLDVLGDHEFLEADASLGGDHVTLGNTTKGAGVQGEWSVDEQQSGGEDLQEDDALSLMTSSQQDQNLAGHQGLAGLAHVLSEAGSCWATSDLEDD